jgi:hypothetical protein
VPRPADPASFELQALSEGTSVSVLYPATIQYLPRLNVDRAAIDPGVKSLYELNVSSPFLSVNATGPVVASAQGPLQLKMEDEVHAHDRA